MDDDRKKRHGEPAPDAAAESDRNNRAASGGAEQRDATAKRRSWGILPDNPRPLIALLIILAAVGILVFLFATRSEIQPREAVERVWTVSVEKAKAADVEPDLRLFGTIVAGQDAELRPLVSGRVVELGKSFAEGAVVEEGELLLRIDPFDYEAAVSEAEAQLTEAQARLSELDAELKNQREQLPIAREQASLREREVQRRVGLRSRGSGSQKAVDDSRLALNEQRQRVTDTIGRIETLQARIAQQMAAVRRAEVALRRARRNLADTEIRAPFSGFIRETNAAVGQRISTTEKIAKIVDARWMEVEFQISDAQYARLVGRGALRGRPVDVLWRTDSGNFTFKATIQRIAGAIANQSGGINLYARIAETELDTPLRPGAFVEVSVKDRLYRKVFRLPDTAVEDDERVFVVVDGRLQARQVTIVGRAGGDILVRGELIDGDNVVTNIFPEIGPGLKVQIR